MTTVSDQTPGALPELVDAPPCEHCGAAIARRKHGGGRRQRYCNQACRHAARRAADRVLLPSGAWSDRVRPGRRLEGGGGPVLAADPVGTRPESQPFADSLGTTQSLRHSQVRGVEALETYATATFQTPGETHAGPTRRRARYKLRSALVQVTTVDRCRRCGVDILGGAVVIKKKGDVAHFANLESCGRIWLCAVCSAKIRARRGDEIAEAVGRWITQGHAAYFATATLSHDQGDALQVSLDVLGKSWRSLLSGKSYQEEKQRYGLVGNIKTVEITYGRNGWHPHIHAILLADEWIDLASGEMAAWFARLDARWARALVRHGWTPGKYTVRFTLYPVTVSPGALAGYVTKVQDGGLGHEMTSDLKHGRLSSRTPMQILADFATDGLVADLDLWHEYEIATEGRSAIRWSKGLRDVLLPDVEEQTDEEIAAEDVGGDEIAALLPHVWNRITRIPGADAAVLDAVEQDGMEGLIRLLVGYRLDINGVLTPEEWAEIGGHQE